MMSLVQLIVEYHTKLIPSLFISGFTIGSFLFTLKSVIIKTMKDDVYDSDEYQEVICQRISLGEEIGFYDSLKRFSNLIMKAIYFSFLSASLQITIGFFENIYTTIICMFAAGISWFFLIKSVYIVQQNWQKAFQYSEDRTIKKNKSRIEELKVKND
jgi:hypothetical protein